MKNFAMVAAALLLLSTPAYAAQVQWTADASTTSCDFILNSGAVVTVAVVSGKCLQDVSAAPVGPNTAKATSKLVDPIWGNATGTQATYSFTRPGAPGVLTSPTLVP